MNIGNAVPCEVPIVPKQPVKVYLSAPQRELLNNIAKSEEISRSEVLRNAFIKYVQTSPKVLEALKENNEVGKK